MWENGETGFRNVVHHAADAILVADPTGKIVYVNDKLCRMVRSAADQVCKGTIHDLFSEEGKKSWGPLVADVLRIGEAVVGLQMVRTDKSIFEAEIGFSTAAGDKIVLTVRDMTDRIAERERCRRSAEFFKSLADGSKDLIFSVDSDRFVNYLNNAFCTITGWSKWIWMGRDLSLMIHPDDIALWKHNLKCVLGGQPSSQFQTRLRCSNGDYFDGECGCSPMRQDGRVAGMWHVIESSGNNTWSWKSD